MRTMLHLQCEPSPGVKRSVLRVVYHRHNGRCFYCDCATFVRRVKGGGRHAANTATFDHIVTAGEGGPYEAHNGVLACFRCNNRRGSLPFAAFAIRSHGANGLSGDRNAPPAAVALIGAALDAWAQGRPLTATPADHTIPARAELDGE